MKDLILYWSLEEARTGDFARIAGRLRLNILSDDERKFLADYLEGKVKPRRLKGGRTARDEDMIVQTVLYLEATDPNHQRESAVSHTCKVFNISRRYVFKLLDKIDPERLEAIQAGATALAGSGIKIKLVHKT